MKQRTGHALIMLSNVCTVPAAQFERFNHQNLVNESKERIERIQMFRNALSKR